MTWNRKKFFSSFVLSLAAIVTFARAAWCLPEAPPLLQEMEQLSGTRLHYSFHAGTGKVRFLAPEAGVAISRHTVAALPSVSGQPALAAPEAVARGFMARYGSLFGVADQSTELTVKRARKTGDGRSFVKFQQVHQGLPVIAGELVVQTDAQNDILSIHGKASPDIQLYVTPAVGAAAAKTKALQLTATEHKTDPAKLKVSEPVLSIYNPTLLGAGANKNSLVWQLEVTATDLSPIREYILIDAKRGYVALHFNQVDTALDRKVYDNYDNSYNELPGPYLVRSEGVNAIGILDVDNAYDYAGYTYDFYYTNFGRDGIDNHGMTITSTVEYCDPNYACPFQNAFWNGTQMVYGDGFASALDVVGHELTHGVTQYESGLFYFMQSGAIDESLSDVFGEFIDLTYGPDRNNPAVRWKIGQDLPKSIGIIRDMKNPPLYKQPDRMKSGLYYCGYNDNGGVHANNGVNNKAAYLMTDGATFNGKTVTGLGIIKASKIYYETQTNLLTSGSDYADLYDFLQLACQNLTGDISSGISAADCTQVKNAVDAVQMNQQPSCPSPDAPLCSTAGGITPVTYFYDDMEDQGAKWTPSDSSGVWGVFDQYATSGIYSLYGQGYNDYTNSSEKMTNAVSIPVGAYMHFNHFYEFSILQNLATKQYVYPDGGIVEYSTDGGSSWTDALPLFNYNGYSSAKLLTGYGNFLEGRRAFVGLTRGFTSSRLNLANLSGQEARFRFTIGTSDWASLTNAFGWLIDDVQIYTCQMTGSIAINNNVTYTNKNAVTLSLTSSVPKGTGVMVQFNNGDGIWSAWQAFSASKSWKLMTGDGLKTVIAHFKHSSGAVSPDYPATITLDTTKPTNGTLSLTRDALSNIDLNWSDFQDDLSHIKKYSLFYSTSAVPAACSGTGLTLASDMSTSYHHAGLTAGKTYYYRVCATDNAGNISTGATASMKAASELNPPTNGSISINGNAPFTNSTAVKLTLSATDDSGPVAKMCISNTNTCSSWVPYATSKAWTLLAGDGAKTVNVWFRDKFDNDNTTPYPAIITLDTTKPTVTLSLTKGINQIQLDWSSLSDLSGIKKYSLFYSNSAIPAGCSGTGLTLASDTSTEYNHTGLTAGKTYYYRVCATDNAGNISTGATASMKAASELNPPTNGFISINAGVPNTNSTAVKLTLSATDDSGPVAKMCISNTNACSSWVPYATSKAWTLTAGDGAKTVNVWFRDKFDNDTPAPYSATITLQ